MKNLLALAFFMLSTLAFASNTGHIHFQADSTWVNPVTNRTLCYDNGTFYAKVASCIQTRMVRGDEECMRWGKKTISQPANSSRMVCVEERGRSGQCVRYARVSYNQSRDRDVDFEGDRGGVIRSEVVTIPACK
jgi:hypothetical protein